MEQRLNGDSPHAAGSQLDEPADVLSSAGRTALVIAHPGHELCLHGWLGLARPEVFILTDGSGRLGTPRLDSTAKILDATGARPGGFFGPLVDRSIYQALLRRDVEFFTELASELARVLAEGRFRYVVGDAFEGYNPTHDICRVLADVAVELANRRDPSRRIESFDFPIVGPVERDAGQPGGLRLRLDERAFVRKMEAVRSCPELADEVGAMIDGADLGALDSFVDLAGEVKELMAARGGADFLRVEHLRRVAGVRGRLPEVTRPLFYERYGERLVSLGHYTEAIRYREHFVPVAEALFDFAAPEGDFAGPRDGANYSSAGA